MPAHDRDLTDTQWLILDPLIPKPTRRRDGRGRPWTDRRSVLNAILWVLRTGAPWADVPDRYPSYQTCHRRFQQWVRSGITKGLARDFGLAFCELKGRQRARAGERIVDFSFQFIVDDDASGGAVSLRDLVGLGLVPAVHGCVVRGFLRLPRSCVKCLL
jgi:transposase